VFAFDKFFMLGLYDRDMHADAVHATEERLRSVELENAQLRNELAHLRAS